MQTCTVADCTADIFVKSRGLCRKHYHRWWRTGNPLQAHYDRASGTPIERWWAKVEKGDGCWPWRASLDSHGYGQFDVTTDDKHKNHRAHRWGYQQLVRVLAADETLDHLCRNHACVRPDHLEPVSNAENVRRGEAGKRNADKTHCPKGHEYDGVDKSGRFCVACRRESNREKMRRIRGYKGNQPNSEKTHCNYGHKFTPENTIVRGSGRGCRECSRKAAREYMRRRRASDS